VGEAVCAVELVDAGSLGLEEELELFLDFLSFFLVSGLE
jgi:hypothetical protein